MLAELIVIFAFRFSSLQRTPKMKLIYLQAFKAVQTYGTVLTAALVNT